MFNPDSVRNEDGCVSRAASMAYGLSQICERVSMEKPLGPGKMIHITSHSESFRLQQALVLAEVFAGKRNLFPTQVCFCF